MKNLPSGTLISIKAWRSAKCWFQSATDQQLLCGEVSRGHLIGIPDQLTFNRRDVRQVRLELSSETNAALGAGIGAAAGVAIGSIANAAHPHSGEDARFWCAIGGAVIGGVVSGDIRLVHGRIIYKR